MSDVKNETVIANQSEQKEAEKIAERLLGEADKIMD